MVWAIKPSGAWPIHLAEARVMYEPKRSTVVSKAYSNCIIPTTHGYTLICF
jgi:hypothetical protein